MHTKKKMLPKSLLRYLNFGPFKTNSLILLLSIWMYRNLNYDNQYTILYIPGYVQNKARQRQDFTTIGASNELPKINNTDFWLITYNLWNKPFSYFLCLTDEYWINIHNFIHIEQTALTLCHYNSFKTNTSFNNWRQMFSSTNTCTVKMILI